LTQKAGHYSSVGPEVEVVADSGVDWNVKAVTPGEETVKEGAVVDEVDQIITIYVKKDATNSQIKTAYDKNADAKKLFTAKVGVIGDAVVGSDEVAETVTYEMNEEEGLDVYTIHTKKDATLEDIADIWNSNDYYSTLFTAEAVTDSPYKTKGRQVAGTNGASTVVATPATLITDIKAGVKFGAKYSNGLLYNSAENVQLSKAELGDFGSAIGIVIVNPTGEQFFVSGDTTKDGFFAKPGTYSPVFTYTMNGKSAEVSSSLMVKNTTYVPTVDVTGRTVDSFSADDVKKVLKASVDMNNENLAASVGNDLVKAVSATGEITPAEESNSQLNVKYVGVVEDGITCYVPISSTFSLK
jgi:hypothetical protein